MAKNWQLYWQYYWPSPQPDNIPQANDANPARTVTDQAGRQVALPEGRDSSHDVQHSYFPPGPRRRRQAAGRWGSLGHQTLGEPSLETVGTVGRSHLDREPCPPQTRRFHTRHRTGNIRSSRDYGHSCRGDHRNSEEVLAAIPSLGKFLTARTGLPNWLPITK